MDHLTLCCHTPTSATLQYTNYDFLSFVKFNGCDIAAGDGGIFQINTGDTDNNTDIDAYFKTCLTNFGSEFAKHLRTIWIAFESDGDLIVQTSVEDDSLNSYNLSVIMASFLFQTEAIPLHRDLYGVFWAVKISNSGGCNFSIDTIQVVPIVMAHRRRINKIAS